MPAGIGGRRLAGSTDDDVRRRRDDGRSHVAPAVDQFVVFGCYSIVLQLSRLRGGSGGRRLSEAKAPGRIGIDQPVGRLTVLPGPGCEEGSPAVRHDPGILAGAPGDEARATSRAVGRTGKALRLLVHHATYSISLRPDRSRLMIGR